MEIPSKLKVILIIWSLIGTIWVVGLGIILLIGIVQSIIGTSPNPFPFNIIIFIIVLSFLAIGMYLMRICYNLWHAKGNAEFPLRIFAVLGLLNIPLGTILGIFTLKMLGSDEVKTFLNKGEPPMTKERLISETKSPETPLQS